MKTVYVESSVIESISHKKKKEEMIITFLNGNSYLYKGVPRDIFKEFVSAPSIGKYFHANIKNFYDAEHFYGKEE